MKHIILSAIGDVMDSLFLGIREFPTERVILLAQKGMHDKAAETMTLLEGFRVPTRIAVLEDNTWEGIFKAVRDIKKLEKDPSSILINTATGNASTISAMTSAAFVNGIMAFSVADDEIIMLPVLRFSYYNVISQKKMEILKLLHEKKHCCSSLEDLSKEMGMSLPLISYHVNGNMKSPGLQHLGLVDTNEHKGKIGIHLSLQGRLLVKGYL